MAVFELSGALAPAIPELAVGPWRSAPGLVAFDAAGPPESVWRVDLARDLAASRAALAGAERSVASTHAALDDAPRRFDRALAQALAERVPPEPGGPGWLDAALDRIADLARGRARIETRIEGALVARSVMTLSGDTEVWAAPRLSLAGAQLHARSVAIAVRTRHAWARILTLIVRSASRIFALGLPAAAMSALPLVWRFVRDVLREAGDRDATARSAV